jgi:hypothetical protein
MLRPFGLVGLSLGLCLLVADASGSGVAFTYDLSGRVTQALYDNCMRITYSYDASGNRTAQVNAIANSPIWGSGVWGCFSWTP